MIVADTSAIVALADSDDRHHQAVRALFEADPGLWVLPWSILAEVDYMLGSHVGPGAQDAFIADLADGALEVDWGSPADLPRAHTLHTRYRSLRLGLVDAVVIATAERVHAKAIATLDLRHFGAVAIRGRPKLLPRDH